MFPDALLGQGKVFCVKASKSTTCPFSMIDLFPVWLYDVNMCPLFISPAEALEEQKKKKTPSGKPAVAVFREKWTAMVDLLHTSLVRFPGILAKHEIFLDDATRDKAISPKPDADVAINIMKIIKMKVKKYPRENFEKFIDCLNDADSFFFEREIEELGQCS